MRLSSGVDKRLYNQDRDLAWNFHPTMKLVIEKLDSEAWGELFGTESTPAESKQVAEAVNGILTTIQQLQQNPAIAMEDAVRISGLDSCCPLARTRAFAMIGNTMFGMFWQAAKEVSSPDQCPISDVASLVEAGEQMIAAIGNQPRQKSAKDCKVLSGLLGRFIFWR